MKELSAELGLRQTSDVESLLHSLRKDFLQKVIPASSTGRLCLRLMLRVWYVVCFLSTTFCYCLLENLVSTGMHSKSCNTEK